MSTPTPPPTPRPPHTHPSPPQTGDEIFKKWWGWEFFTRSGGKPRMGGRIFKVSLRSWQGGVNPITLRRPPPFFSNFNHLPAPTSQHFQSPLPLLFLFFSFFGWMGDHATFDVLFYMMIMWICSCQVCVLCNKASNLLRSDTTWFFTGTLIISHTQTEHSTHTEHTQGVVDWHTHTVIYLQHLLCAHSSYLYSLND